VSEQRRQHHTMCRSTSERKIFGAPNEKSSEPKFHLHSMPRDDTSSRFRTFVAVVLGVILHPKRSSLPWERISTSNSHPSWETTSGKITVEKSENAHKASEIRLRAHFGSNCFIDSLKHLHLSVSSCPLFVYSFIQSTSRHSRLWISVFSSHCSSCP